MKIWRIFLRDLKVDLRQFISIWIILAPVVIALVIRLATPGISDTPVTLVMLGDDAPDRIAYYAQYANVELAQDEAAARSRVLARDHVLALLPAGAEDNILAQGNEPQAIVDAVKLLETYQETGITGDAGRVSFHSLGRTSPPLKTTLVSALAIVVTILSGMLIAINIVEEKEDRTLRALRVAPLRLWQFVMGKSLIGVFNSILCTVLVLWTAGFAGVNLAQALLLVCASSLLCFLVGFLSGLSSEDFIGATASIKILMLPAIAPVLAFELLSEKWQWVFYWDPFYWGYAGMRAVLSQTAGWPYVWQCAGLIVGLTALVYLVSLPVVRKKLR